MDKDFHCKIISNKDWREYKYLRILDGVRKLTKTMLYVMKITHTLKWCLQIVFNHKGWSSNYYT
jgi:hypothetical protein